MELELVSRAKALLNPCRACPRHCMVNRLGGEVGYCRIGEEARLASAGTHFGEESVLVGRGGSGTIFFNGCNLRCAFCQNCTVSQTVAGIEMTAEQLSGVMLNLQSKGVSNINLVSPSHVAPQILEALVLARQEGLTLPVIYNSGGYDSVEMLKLLRGHIQIYMPDFKYADSEAAGRYSDAPDYEPVAEAALAEMFRQVGKLDVDERGLARRGVLVRHLVMPLNVAESRKVLEIVARVAPGAAIHVMGQYRPSFRAAEFPELLLLPAEKEIEALRQYATSLGLVRVD
jgi:putative pyruvate formate lyase activating enzyme